MARRLICKGYHRAPKTWPGGRAREPGKRKSTCPKWAMEDAVQRSLLDTALTDPARGKDSHGHDKIIWNAMNGYYFIGVSTNLPEPTYNCYPEIPPGDRSLRSELQKRVDRKPAEIVTG